MPAWKTWGSWVAIAPLALACGGGGGGGGIDAAGISQNGAEDIAGAVLRATVLSTEVSDLVDAGVDDDPGPAQLGGEVPGRDVPAFLRRAPFGPTPVACEESGSAVVSGDVATPGTYAAGDRVLGDFMLCDDDNGFVLDGIYGFTVVSLVGDLLGDDFDATLDLTMTDFVADDGVDVVRYQGDLRLDYDLSQDPLVLAALSGSSLRIELDGESFTLTGFDTSLEVDTDESPDAYEVIADGRLTSSAFTGFVDYDTTTAFTGVDGSPPDVGGMVITGASNASITVDVIDEIDVDLLVDLNGDGSPDVLVATTWAELGL
jgi:hypothetical protein